MTTPRCIDEEHIKVYDTRNIQPCFPPIVRWICSVCFAEGSNNLDPANYNEYEIIKANSHARDGIA